VARFIRSLLKHRLSVSLALVVTLAAALVSARSIRLQFQFRDFYDFPGNAASERLKRSIETFGDSAGYLVAVVQADDVFRPEVLAYLRRVTNELTPKPAFSRVISLSNAQAIRGKGDDVLTGPLLTELPLPGGGVLDELRRFALSSRLLSPQLVAADGKTTAILAELRTPSAYAGIDEQRAAIAILERALASTPAPPGVKTVVTGSPVVDVGVTDALIGDQLVLVPAVIAALCAVLFVAFRSAHGVVFCLTSVGVSTIWTAGAFALLERPVDIIASLVPTTILVYGVVDPIFVLARVRQKLEAGRDKPSAIEQAFSELGLPCFLTSLTTALGFAAFAAARQPTIRYYGLTVAGGVLLSWVTSMTVLPILLSVSNLPERRVEAQARTRWLDDGLRGTWAFLQPRTRGTLLVTALLLVGGAWFAHRQRLDNVYVDELPRGATRDNVRLLEQKLTGVLGMAVYLEGPRDSMKQPEVVKRIEALDRELSKGPGVTLVSSLADLVAEANQAFMGGDVEQRKVPASRALIAQYLALVDARDRASLITDDGARSQLSLLLRDSGSSAARAFVVELERAVKRAGFQELGVRATVTGKAVVGYGELDDVVRGLLSGFVFAFAVIVLLQWAVFRSLRIALISVVPNLLPVIACFLCLRLLHIRLRIDTALVLCISVGGLFNTTIHFAARVRQLALTGPAEPDEVISTAMRSVGPPALFTAAALSVGFAVLLASNFPGLRALGLLTVVTLSVGFVSDMVVTAVLLRLGFDWRRSSSSVLEALPPTAMVEGVATSLER